MHRRHLEDRNVDDEWEMNMNEGVSYGYENNEYTTSCDFSDDDGLTLVCTTCLADGSYCVKDRCDYGFTDDFISMTCSFCATRSEGGDNDYDFCMSITCDLSKVSSGGATNLEDYCGCDFATLNGNQCSKCEFCNTDGIDYNAQTWKTDTGSLSAGMDLQCPDMYLLEADGESMTCPAKTFFPGSPATWAVPIGLGLIVLGAGLYYFFIRKPKMDEKREKLVDICEGSKRTDGVMT